MSDSAERNKDTNETISFKEKLKTINFGTVPGGYKDSNRYDNAALEQVDWPSKEEIMDNREDYKRAPVKEVPVANLPGNEA